MNSSGGKKATRNTKTKQPDSNSKTTKHTVSVCAAFNTLINLNMRHTKNALIVCHQLFYLWWKSHLHRLPSKLNWCVRVRCTMQLFAKNAEKEITLFPFGVFLDLFYKREITTPCDFVKSIHLKCYGVSEILRHKCQIPIKSSGQWISNKMAFHTHTQTHPSENEQTIINEPSNRSTTNQKKRTSRTVWD